VRGHDQQKQCDTMSPAISCVSVPELLGVAHHKKGYHLGLSETMSGF
jgi:hypothetical protein